MTEKKSCRKSWKRATLLVLIFVVTTSAAMLDIESIRKGVREPRKPVSKISQVSTKTIKNNFENVQKAQEPQKAPAKKVVTEKKSEPVTPSKFSEFKRKTIKKLLPVITPFRKDDYNHALLFFILAIIVQILYPKVAVWKKNVGLTVYGGFIEIMQSLVPWRNCEFSDFIADIVGMSLFFVPFLLIRFFWRKLKRA